MPRTKPVSGPTASIGLVLLLLCLACLAVIHPARAAHYARIGRGAERVALRYELGRAKLFWVALLLGLNAVTLGVPLGMIVYWLTQRGAARSRRRRSPRPGSSAPR